jgi:hypothetical protein
LLVVETESATATGTENARRGRNGTRENPTRSPPTALFTPTKARVAAKCCVARRRQSKQQQQAPKSQKAALAFSNNGFFRPAGHTDGYTTPGSTYDDAGHCSDNGTAVAVVPFVIRLLLCIETALCMALWLHYSWLSNLLQ